MRKVFPHTHCPVFSSAKRLRALMVYLPRYFLYRNENVTLCGRNFSFLVHLGSYSCINVSGFRNTLQVSGRKKVIEKD